MSGNDPDPKVLAELRRLAEERVRDPAGRPPANAAPDALSPDEARRLLHELQVHQVELEMQNEELREAQIRLEVSRNRYFDLYDLAPTGYFTADGDGILLETNLTFASMLGLDRSRVARQPLTRFIAPEDQDTVYLHRRRLLESGERQSFEARLRREQGAPVWTAIEMVLARGETVADGGARFLASVSDITKRKAAEAQAKTFDILEAVLEHTRAATAFLDRDFNYLWVNSALAAECRRDRSYFPGRNHYDLYPEAAKWALFLQARDTAKPVYVAATPFCFANQPDRQVSYWDWSLVPICAPDGRVERLVLTLTDVTQRVHSEATLALQEEALRQRNEELTRFAYLVSHDMKSPLVTVMTFLGYLKQNLLDQDAAAIAEDVDFIQKAADRMVRLLDDLLALSRVEAPRDQTAEESFKAIVDEALEIVAGRVAARGVEVGIADVPVVLVGDRERLVGVFQNLIDNAVKFLGDQVAPRVTVGVDAVGDDFVFFVRDNGIGIDLEQAGTLFGLFQKLDPASEGSGLGLALIKRIVEGHGGRIWVESAGPGQGATFRFTLAGTRMGSGAPAANPGG